MDGHSQYQTTKVHDEVGPGREQPWKAYIKPVDDGKKEPQADTVQVLQQGTGDTFGSKGGGTCSSNGLSASSGRFLAA